ncbi:MAG: glycosyltransferase [Candidatus Aminicenantes bacterium]|nr:glycosyltransferase [Candidatus Aminicenantes bacterium]
MKIAVDTSCLLINRFSGLSEVVHNLLLHLPHVAEDNHFTLFMNYFRATKNSKNISYPGTVNHFFRLPRRLVGWWWKRAWPPLDYCLKGMDVYHSLHIQIPPTRYIKTVLTVHDCRYLAFPELYKHPEVESYHRQMTISLNRVDLVAAVSEFTRQEILTYFPISESRVRVIHNGFSPWMSDKDRQEEKTNRFIEAKNLPQEYLLYIGVLEPRKNLGRLIEAIAQCRQEIHDFPDLVIAGVSHEQWPKSDLARRAKELGIFDNIYLSGVIEKDILWGLTQKATALCYPSLYEGFGFPPLEAMSLGVPVLAGKSSSIPEVSGNAACLVNPLSVDDIANGLRKIVLDGDYRQILVESGYRQIKKFSWQKAAVEYITLYQEALTS